MEKTTVARAKGRRRIYLVAGAVAIFAALATITGCPPQSFKQTASPREGNAIAGKVAIVFSKDYEIKVAGIEKLHTHPQKYGPIYLKLLTDGIIKPEDVFVPEPLSDDQIKLVHTQEFVDSLNDSAAIAKYLEAPFLKNMPGNLVDIFVTKVFRRSSGGTSLAGRLALKYGIAINLAGGYHHAKPDAGEGFCIFNDLAIAIRLLQKQGLVRRAMVVDLDVHHGNGTAVCLQNDPNIFIFDMYEQRNYPSDKQKVSLAIPLEYGTNDSKYLAALSEKLPGALDQFKPQIVFFQAGADILEGDRLGHQKVTPDGLVSRDAIVIDQCSRRGIPVAMTLGGGYSDDAWKAQCASIERTIRKYALVGRPGQYPLRQATAKESLYTK